MSKAVLIVDMPECCKKCNYSAENYDGNDICSLQFGDEDYMIIENVNIKPDNCPLHPLPQPMEVRGKYPKSGPVPSYRIGWNECLKAIDQMGANGGF